LKIGLNATCLNERPSGAKQRFVGIYGELFKLLPEVEFVIYEPADCQVGSWFVGTPNVSVRRTPLPSQGRIWKILGGLGYWPTAFSKEQFDIFENFSQPLVKSPTGSTLLTVHDVRRIHSDGIGWERMVYKAALARDLRVADHVITVSHSMKNEILDFFPSSSISVIYNGLESCQFDAVTEADLLATRQKYKLPKDFVLAVGHHEKRKNYIRLVDAIERLRDQGVACSLVIVGNESGQGVAIAERIRSANISDQVKILSGLSDLEVRCAFKLCNLHVFPSSYEGFGIPILEAMAVGSPMVLSDIPVFREITQNQGVYFSHNDSDEIALAIDKVLTSTSERERQIKYGYERVQEFNFKSLAGQLANLYKTLSSK
jgi:glycosyltransferase involved in cell wall biosynthesis